MEKERLSEEDDEFANGIRFRFAGRKCVAIASSLLVAVDCGRQRGLTVLDRHS